MFDKMKEKNVKSRKLSVASESALSKSTEQHTHSSEQYQSEIDLDHDRGTNQDSSESDCMSTEGDESDPNSPLLPDKQYLNQSNDLKAALISSKALVGDYIELKNCKRCGSMIFKVSILKSGKMLFAIFNILLIYTFNIGSQRSHQRQSRRIQC